MGPFFYNDDDYDDDPLFYYDEDDYYDEDNARSALVSDAERNWDRVFNGCGFTVVSGLIFLWLSSFTILPLLSRPESYLGIGHIDVVMMPYVCFSPFSLVAIVFALSGLRTTGRTRLFAIIAICLNVLYFVVPFTAFLIRGQG